MSDVKRRAVIYCRVSSKKQTVDGSGLDSQEHRCRQYATAQGYAVDKVFQDDVSGGGDFMNRPGMVALLKFLSKSREEYVVIFDDLKRFARDTVFHLTLRQRFAAYNATVECLNFKFEDTPEGQFVETVVAAQGELERLQNRRQVIQKMKSRIERGYYVFGKPIGYRYLKTKPKAAFWCAMNRMPRSSQRRSKAMPPGGSSFNRRSRGSSNPFRNFSEITKAKSVPLWFGRL